MAYADNIVQYATCKRCGLMKSKKSALDQNGQTITAPNKDALALSYVSAMKKEKEGVR